MIFLWWIVMWFPLIAYIELPHLKRYIVLLRASRFIVNHRNRVECQQTAWHIWCGESDSNLSHIVMLFVISTLLNSIWLRVVNVIVIQIHFLLVFCSHSKVCWYGDCGVCNLSLICEDFVKKKHVLQFIQYAANFDLY